MEEAIQTVSAILLSKTATDMPETQKETLRILLGEEVE